MSIILSILLSIIINPTDVAWGANGHRIVAQICEWHMDDKAMASVKEIIGDEYLAEIANWPDYIKSEKGWKFADSWHYTTIHADQTVADVKKIYAEDSKINDAIEAYELMIAILKNDIDATDFLVKLTKKNKAKLLNDSPKATALAFIVHLIGDIHQPLHVGKNNDHGGNKITVEFFGDRSNVHSVWDSGIIEHEKLSYTEFATFINKLDKSEIHKLQASGIEDWAQESIEMREHIYNTLYDYTDRESGLPSFSWNYQHDNIPLVEERLVTAGVRLAGVLNELYK